MGNNKHNIISPIVDSSSLKLAIDKITYDILKDASSGLSIGGELGDRRNVQRICETRFGMCNLCYLIGLDHCSCGYEHMRAWAGVKARTPADELRSYTTDDIHVSATFPCVISSFGTSA